MKIIHHGMPVTGTGHNPPVGAAAGAAAILFVEQCANDLRHMHGAGDSL
jgi:hypothetical protein